MCVKCTATPNRILYREVSIRALLRMEEIKQEIASNNETVTKVEWFIDKGEENYVGIVTYKYFVEEYEHLDAVMLLSPIQ